MLHTFQVLVKAPEVPQRSGLFWPTLVSMLTVTNSVYSKKNNNNKKLVRPSVLFFFFFPRIYLCPHLAGELAVVVRPCVAWHGVTEACACVRAPSCRKRSSPTCPPTSCTCSGCRRCVSTICAATSARRCSSEVRARDGPALATVFVFGPTALRLVLKAHECHFIFFLSANTTRIFEGSRIVKTGMVSESAEIQLFFVSVR